MKRRAFFGMAAALLAPRLTAAPAGAPVVLPRVLVFPRDHGAHPEYRIEWWYLTGWLQDERAAPLGFQVTFFRTRNPAGDANPSRFAPRQILFAHAAISDPAHGRLLHDARSARAALGLAGAERETTRVWIDDWRLALEGDTYRARIAARAFDLDLEIEAAGAPLAQGEAGLSRKGRRPQEASYYYSRPQLKVRGQAGGRRVTGSAWLDHEWSQAYLAPEAAGWDWTGINLEDGGAMMAFVMRARDGGVHYAGATLRTADGTVRSHGPDAVKFEVLRRWRSPRTGVDYPVAMRVTVGTQRWVLEPLMDDQELDSRSSTGTIYWEGAVRARPEGGAPAGRGYLELTGYWKPMTL